MMASSRGRNRSSSWDGSGFGRIGCLLNQAEEHAIMNRAETEDSSYASARNRKLLAEWAAKTGENEYAEPALNPCQTTAYAFFTGDALGQPYAANLLCASPVPSRDHPPRNVALSPVYAELPRCRGTPGRARDRDLVRNGPALGPEVRPRLRPQPAPAAAETNGHVALGRDGGH